MAKMVKIRDMQPAFSNAMRALIAKCGPEIMSMATTMNAWKDEYDSYILHDKEFNWESVAFKSEQDQIMFMLKWGG